jgi:pheromone shutdown protein TraB
MTRLVHTSTVLSSSSTAQTSAQPVVSSAMTSDDSRPLAGMLLAAAMAALLVAADQVIDSWVDGHLLAAWVALWTVTFAALALLATPLRKVSNTGAGWVSAYLKARKERRQEEDMWELARHDSRVMAEIRMASIRQTQG